ncbi:MAG: daptomycin-sensing surface protein LiaX [Pisciglobus halotolerans]|nr:daptomycin-sensing surface protein LiaX [Pisciglobus halotolerans]
MKERERILELVKDGVISTEEALLLLENIAGKEGYHAMKKDRSSMEKATFETYSEQKQTEETKTQKDHTEEDYRKADAQLKAEQEKDRLQLEAILEELANEASGYSVEIDALNEDIKKAEHQKDSLDEKLMVLQTLEDLDELEPDKKTKMDNLEKQISSLEEKIADLKDDREDMEDKMRNVRKKQWKEQKKQVKERFELPEDWKETAHKTLNDVNEKVSDAGSHLGDFLKDSFSSVMDSMEWKEVNVKVPGLVSTKFEHTFTYEETKATILNIKLANGNVVFKQSANDDIKVEASIKLYGKINENEQPLEAFTKRSNIMIDEDTFTFHVPNKSVRVDLIVYLPKRTYDHTQIKLLNGNVAFERFEGNDVYVKSTNGTLSFDHFHVTMLEAEGVNGSVNILNSRIRDLIAMSVNGSLTVRGNVKSSNLSTVNGTVRLTLTGDDIVRVEASSVNGSVKVSVPKEAGLEIEARTNLGSIQNRMTNTEIVKEKKERTNHLMNLRRGTEGEAIVLNLKTTTGTVMLKDGE